MTKLSTAIFLSVLALPMGFASADSAPDIYRDFLIAVIKGDRMSTERLALPNADLGILIPDEPMPLEAQMVSIAQITASPYRVLKIGETFALPNGQAIGPSVEMESAGWVIIANDVDPLPHRLKMTEDGWKVDAGDLIGARKAASRSRK
jgi:hypothetical protein